jgi:hypothetical protein
VKHGTLWVFLAVLALGCSSPSVEALLVLVDFAPQTSASCVEVVVRSTGSAELSSGPMKTQRLQPLRVGVKRNELASKITVFAVGFSDADCKVPTVPPERSDDAIGTFKAGGVVTVPLKLSQVTNSKDADGDGYTSVVSGGDDCDDANPSIHPGAHELCGDHQDNNCDRATDCEEASCANQTCGAGGAICKPPRCSEQVCSDDLDNDGDGLKDCADADCEGASCLNGGSCQNKACKGASTEKDLCGDGSDNDSDGKTDCEDADCLGSLCNAHDACLTGARCDSSKECSGATPVVCSAPTSSCQKMSGTCNPADGGCLYPPDTGKLCDDLNGCTSSDTCSDAGVCAGAAISCTAPGLCMRSAGCANDAGCIFVAAVGYSCDDGNNCTTGDLCQSDAGCRGSVTSCNPPNECQQFSNQCSGDGGCLFTVAAAGAPCTGGVCNSTGGCIPTFPFAPSNFTESMLPTPGAPTTLACALTLDSHLGDGGVGFGGWCGNQTPPWQLISQPGGSDAVLLSFSDLDLAPDASVALRGDRPVIFASTGAMKIQGQLVSGAGWVSCSNGGAGGPSAGVKGAGGGGFGSVGGGGGNLGAAGGVVNGDPFLIPLRGGCPGGNGARGGGGLQLSAATSLSITGIVAAPGSWGDGGESGDIGGSGAGSGGGILLEGLFVLTGPVSAITANGGSGGEGGGPNNHGRAGATGSINSAVPAVGGDGSTNGGKGGNGATGTTAATVGATVSGQPGGGGGGAGVGRVRINAASGCSLANTGVLSPVPTSNQSDAGCP